ncbi:MAG: plasmid pRiA4b ORF-3 family protein [Synergistaceae bacterium]|nr:plasmid pRiA4b ORF-3 family protein [Synergistaceae bacterium]
MASQPIYQFYAELDDFTPKIWRRFQVPGNVTFARLGYITMTLFEMTASHLFALEMPLEYPGGECIWHYEIPFEDGQDLEESDSLKLKDATKCKLCRVTSSAGTHFNFNYDFGDNWWVSMVLEAVFKDETLQGAELPRVIEGAGVGIVEDCGGTGGLETLTKAFRKKKGRDYEGFRDWLGVDDFDITEFDIDDMNFRLKKIPRIYARIYEQQLAPTQRSIDLIERKYIKKKPEN